MSFLDSVKGLFIGPESAAGVVRCAEGDAGRVVEALRAVIDPEAGMNVVKMGLIRYVGVQEGVAVVHLTPTTAGCPLVDWLVGACSKEIEKIGLRPRVMVVLDPPWSPDDIEVDR